uniref:FATC domain-containing protein n=1 Tax=Hyaloperonospora arabidopsidis (strain Emoy2) TaxID=559515 RepID=M4C4M7_HYAAE
MVQQMDYIVLALSTAPANDRSCSSESLHDCVQICCSNAVALFDYGRALHDLVEGISMVETSFCELSQVEKQELEVNSTGEDLLREASEATKKLQSCIKAVSEAEARRCTLQDEVVCKQDMHKIIASDRRAAEAEFRTLCSENEDAAAETTCEVHKHVKDMRALLKDLDTHESPLKKVVSAGSESLQFHLQSQTETNTPLSAGRSFPRSTTACSFMKNDQLVKELRRSLRSANHFQMLEGTLQRHEEACIDFQEAIGPIEQALTAFDTQADQLLALEGHPDASALLSLLLDLVEALCLFTEDSQSRVDTSDEAPTTSLLVAGRDIVRRCVKVFFEAIELAGRLTGAEEQSRRPSVGMSMQHVCDEDEEEQHADTDSSANAIAIESGSSIVSGAGSDCGSSNYGYPTASPSYIVEEKSRHGLQVLKRIEGKLSGEVTEMAHAPSTLTVEQQASWLIDEATKIDNLCVMYEGWTPWI